MEQVDTSNILFICGGAFINLDRQIGDRLGASSIGFGAPVRSVPSIPNCHGLLLHHNKLLCLMFGWLRSD